MKDYFTCTTVPCFLPLTFDFSLVFWHEVCTNSVGVVQNLLLAWENGAVSFTDVKKVLDVFKSRICTLPVCISAWLCAYIQVGIFIMFIIAVFAFYFGDKFL